MDNRKVAAELVKLAKELVSAKGITVDEAMDILKKGIKQNTRRFEFSRVYDQKGVGGTGVHMDIGSGHYSIWVEREDKNVVIGVTVSLEGAKEIDAVYYDILDGMEVDSPNDLKRLMDKFFNKLEDAEEEVRLRQEEE